MAKTRRDTQLTFVAGFVQDANTCRAIAQLDALVEQGAARTWLMKWTTSAGWGRFSLPWIATRVCVIDTPAPQLIATGPEGRVAVLSPGGSAEEWIDDSRDGPNGRGPIRDLRVIGGRVYACGMGRQVYRREADRVWSRQDDGMVLARGTVSVAGLNAIDGRDEADLYAVGYRGEIWRRTGGRWSNVVSPTNVILHGVKVAAPDSVFACGQKGVLIHGAGERWREVLHDATDDHLWSVEWFGDRLYVASADELFVLDGDSLVAASPEGIHSFGFLHANSGRLWSFGAKHVCWTADGSTWQDVTPLAGGPRPARA